MKIEQGLLQIVANELREIGHHLPCNQVSRNNHAILDETDSFLV